MDEPARKPRLRFSLTTLVLLTTIAGMGITIAMLWSEVGPLRSEVRRLRDEVGELRVEDRSKLHAIEVETDNQLVWKWRLWIPEGKTYKLRAEGGRIPEEGFPSDGATVYAREPGEMWVEYRIRKDPHSESWTGSLKVKGASAGGDRHQWVDWRSRRTSSSGVTTTTRVAEPGETLLLKRMLVTNKAENQDPPDPPEGFVVWVEPIK